MIQNHETAWLSLKDTICILFGLKILGSIILFKVWKILIDLSSEFVTKCVDFINSMKSILQPIIEKEEESCHIIKIQLFFAR